MAAAQQPSSEVIILPLPAWLPVPSDQQWTTGMMTDNGCSSNWLRWWLWLLGVTVACVSEFDILNWLLILTIWRISAFILEELGPSIESTLLQPTKKAKVLY